MAKQITQETFDDVVRENIKDFDMEVEEAMTDAVTQFEAQGVNLSNIIKDPSIYSEGGQNGTTPAKHTVVMALEHLTMLLQSSPVDLDQMKSEIITVKLECDKDIAHRLMAGKNGAYSILLQCCQACERDRDSFLACLKALCSLFNGQPDLVEIVGMTYFLKQLELNKEDPGTVAVLVKLIRLTCVMHEGNRQIYVSEGLITALLNTLLLHQDLADVVIEVCVALRILVADDDVRVPFGKGHEHARMIVTEEEALKKIMAICHDFKENITVMGELFSTLGRLAVRDEFCREIMDLGGVQLMLAALDHNMHHQGIVFRAIGVLKAVAGNDEAKIKIGNNNIIELIIAAMTRHQRNKGIAEIGCSTLATVSLRQPKNGIKIVQLGGPEAIYKAMQLHPKAVAVQKQACMAIRNIVARNTDLCSAFVDIGIEELIRKALEAHSEVKDEAKASLRDLRCSVELREIWKGEGKELDQ